MGISLAEITAEHLRPFVGEAFGVAVNEGDQPATTVCLKDVVEVKNAPDYLPRPPFSLFFEGAMDPAIAQGMFWFSHPSFESLPIFIVPVRSDGETRTYEAVFN